MEKKSGGNAEEKNRDDLGNGENITQVLPNMNLQKSRRDKRGL
jgi:hypothetical protein